MKALEPIQQMVARELALGFTLSEICAVRKLDVDTWSRITRGKVFKAEIERLSGEIEHQLIQDAGDDPALQKLKVARLKAVDTIVDELDNYDSETGGSASTRLKAATEVLDRVGVSKKQEARIPAVVINISGMKAEVLKEVTGVSTKVLPENVLVEAAPDED